NTSCADCAGVPNGDNVEDNCETCDNNPVNDCEQDCAGTWGGSAVLDVCGECDGGETDPDNCGGSDITDGCDLPDDPNTSYLHLTAAGSVLYKSLYDIAGFQFTVDGASPTGASGGDAGAAGMMIQANSATNIVLGFSLTGGVVPEGCGTLVELDLTGDATGLSGIIMSDTAGGAIYFEYYEESETIAGCMDDSACNYNSDATEDDGSCEYAEENYDCDGNCIVEVDCFGECGGNAVVDECGVCGGSGIPEGE
ncbi:uncharacterized protein METZ01_LOCUS458120, partial [marine metagenome]